MNSSRPILKLTNIAVSYRKRAGFMRWNRFWALKDVSFELFKGETLGIVGGNGSGKSSLLRVVAGIINPDKGEVSRNDCNISMLSLQAGFIPHLTGRENAVLSGMIMGLHRLEIEEKLDEIMRFSELGEFFDEPVKSYSMGMRARLGFSTAIQIDPDILLIDEVLGVGDADFRRKSADVIKQKIKSNKTVVLVSHNMNTLKEVCDRVLWIENGRSIEVGSAESVLKMYQEK